MTGAAGSVLLLVSAAAVGLVAVFLVRLIQQLSRTASEVELLARSINQDLLPRMERVLDKVEVELTAIEGVTESARRVSEGAGRMVGTLEGMAEKARDTADPILDAIAVLAGPLPRGVAIFSGIRAAWGAWRRPRDHGGDGRREDV